MPVSRNLTKSLEEVLLPEVQRRSGGSVAILAQGLVGGAYPTCPVNRSRPNNGIFSYKTILDVGSPAGPVLVRPGLPTRWGREKIWLVAVLRGEAELSNGTP